MIGPFDHHVFAHKDGRYQTTGASPTVGRTHASLLEQYFFGQTNDPGYLSSLAATPGLIWRRIGDRYGLTRVLAGVPDANGRATLRFETLLIPAASAAALLTNLAPIVRAKWQERDQKMVVTGVGSPSPGELHPAVVSEALLALQSGSCAVLSAERVSLADVQTILKRCAHDPAFSLCYRSLNDRAPVSLNLTEAKATRRAAAPRLSEPHMPTLPPVPSRASSAPGAFSLVVTFVLMLLVLAQTGLSIHLRALLNDLVDTETASQQAILDRVEARSQALIATSEGTARAVSDLQASVAQGQRANEQTAQKLTELVQAPDPDGAEVKSSIAEVKQKTTAVKEHLEKLESRLAAMGPANQAAPGASPASTSDAKQLGSLTGTVKGALVDLTSIEKKLDALEKSQNARDRASAVEALRAEVSKLTTKLKEAVGEAAGAAEEERKQ
ncbi:MAG: hypothetical protein AB1716_03910 [Planctomycetota bacterium]